MANKLKLFKSYVTPNPDGCIDRRDAIRNHDAIQSALECFCELLETHGETVTFKESFQSTGDPVCYLPFDALPITESDDYDFTKIELFQNGLRVDEDSCRNPFFRIENNNIKVYEEGEDGVRRDYVAGTVENPCCWTLKYSYLKPFSETLDCLGAKSSCSC